jgi:hypothetical protein
MANLQFNKHLRIEVTIPADVSTAASCTCDVSAMLDDDDLDSAMLTKARILQAVTSAGVMIALAAGKAALSGETLTITEPTAGFTAGDVYLIEFTKGPGYPSGTATKV